MVSILLCQNLGSTFVASHCNMALAICISLLDKLLVGLLTTQTNHICFGFNASNSTHDVISQFSELTALKRLSHKISNHLLGGTPINANFLHVHQIHDEEVSDVNMPLALAT
jgi:hypothetical protein